MTKLNDFKTAVEAKEFGAFTAILDADTTTGKLYSRRLIELFLKGKLLTENLPKANMFARLAA